MRRIVEGGKTGPGKPRRVDEVAEARLRLARAQAAQQAKIDADRARRAAAQARGDFEVLAEDIPEALDVEEVEEVPEMEMEMEMELAPGQTWDGDRIPVGEENVLDPEDEGQLLDLEILDLDEDR